MYSRPSPSMMREPWARSMMSGSPPTARNARTGLSTPPTRIFCAREKRSDEMVTVHILCDDRRRGEQKRAEEAGSYVATRDAEEKLENICGRTRRYNYDLYRYRPPCLSPRARRICTSTPVTLKRKRSMAALTPYCEHASSSGMRLRLMNINASRGSNKHPASQLASSSCSSLWVRSAAPLLGLMNIIEGS